MRHPSRAALLFLLLLPPAAPAAETPPPVAPKKPHQLTLHGVTLGDDYFWLREKDNPEVRAYLEAENAYTAAFMADTAALQERLYQETLGRVKQSDLTVPWRYRGWAYYTRTEEGKQYPIWCRKEAGKEGASEQVLLDGNLLAQGEKFMNVQQMLPSPDGRLLAYTTDNTGARDFVLKVRDLEKGSDLPDRAERVAGVAWASDNKTLLYATTDPAKRAHKLWRLALGGEPVLVFEEKDERFNVRVARARDERTIVFGSASHTASELYLLPADQPAAKPLLVAAREADHEYDAEPAGDTLYIRTNRGCRNFRLVKATVASPGPDSWQELIPCREAVTIERLAAFRGHLVVSEREDALPQLAVLDRKTGERRRVPFPEAIYSLQAQKNAEYDTDRLVLGFTSFTTPPTVYEYGLATGAMQVLKRTEVLGGYDPADYRSERRYAKAADGTRIPLSLVYHKNTRLDGSAPAMLNGYGSYGASAPVNFSYSRPGLIDRGFVWVVAHIRGGGDLGKGWHDQGKMLKKKNTFTDFIAAAEALAEQKIAARDKIVIQGGSAGGLLLGVVTNLRPDLFAAELSQVPFVDVINTMVDETLPLTVGEFEEWGNPRKSREEFEYMLSYSPYDQLRPAEYPPILVRTALNDSQVMYWEPAKYVARMRQMKKDKNPLLLEVNMAAGHGGASGRYDAFREVAFDYAFVLKVLGMADTAPAAGVKL
jgi:oligopeptidase B